MSTPTILDQIVASKRQVLLEQKRTMPLDQIQAGLQVSDRSLKDSIERRKPGYILECKKASPSKGLIRSEFDPKGIAKVYSHFASAISVLTETEYFQGSLEYLKTVREQVQQPVLCKDFFVEPYQVYQTRYYGADIILLILAIIDDEQWTELFELAQSLGMDVITEVSNQSELERARKLSAPIVGINNRNLRDMSIDLDTTRRLAAQLPDDVIVISESGYYTRQQTLEMADCSDAFLIGSSLMAESDLKAAVKKIIFGTNKVCGLTRNEDAKTADDAGAVYGGVIFADSSSRKIAVESVQEIFAGTDLLRVGVFQNQSAEDIVSTVETAALHAVQLHGDEDIQFVSSLRSQLDETCQIWKAISVSEFKDWVSAEVDQLLVDHQTANAKGGTGESFDWTQIPAADRQKVIVAGGIGPENASAVLQLRFLGVDMNSKLETAPGIKSKEQIQKAFEALQKSRQD